jgi:hypothetical protein
MCKIQEFDQVVRHRKEKEKLAKAVLTKHFGDPRAWDEVIELWCTRKRPDFVFFFPIHRIIIEELQHRNYHSAAFGTGAKVSKKSENIRMYEIGQCFAELPDCSFEITIE